MNNKLMITETILRDAPPIPGGHPDADGGDAAGGEILDSIGYWSIECWGGATFDSCLRFLNEDAPGSACASCAEGHAKTKLQMLLRGQNLLGYKLRG